MRQKIRPDRSRFLQSEHNDCDALTEIILEHISPNGPVGIMQRIPRSECIWQPGDRADRLYFLVSGSISIIGIDREGREVVIAMIVPGEPFGALCLCSGSDGERSTTARAAADSEIWEITKEDFIAYMQNNAGILAKFLFTFCTRLTYAEQRISILAMRGVEERLGNALLHLPRMRGVQSSQTRLEIVLNLTHEELSGYTALSRQRVTAVMNHFRELGLVNYSRTQPIVINTKALMEYLYEK
jgi:CRP/FNR family cyclic AMP-dependent transcriptional regulator